MADTKQITATIPEDMANLISKIATVENRSFSQIVAILLGFSTSAENLAKTGLKTDPNT